MITFLLFLAFYTELNSSIFWGIFLILQIWYSLKLGQTIVIFDVFLFKVKTKLEKGAEKLGFELKTKQRDVDKPTNANGGLFIAVCRGKVINYFF